MAKQDDDVWRPARAHKAQTLEIFVPNFELDIRCVRASSLIKLFRFLSGKESTQRTIRLETDLRARTKLLSMVVDAIDTLLEDWYPSLGTRFVHTSEG